MNFPTSFKSEGNPEIDKPTPVMTVMQDMLGADFRGDIWDEAPALYILAANPDVGIAVMDMAVPDEVWGAARPPEVIQLLNVGMLGASKRPPRLTPPEGFDIIAVMFFCEGWAVTTKNADEHAAEVEDAMADARAHTLHLRDDRIEIKTMYAVDLRLNDYCLTYERGNSEPVMTQDMAERTGEDMGLIPDVLTEFLHVVTSTWD